MSSPFPGMDPYLEGPLWTSFHSQLAVEIARQLTPKLVPRYVALTEKRFVTAFPEIEEGVAISTGSVRPDAAVVTEHRTATGGAATDGLLEPPLRLATVVPESLPQLTVEIRDSEGRHLVTAIELPSPWNKRGDGRDEYIAKRGRLLLSTAHLVEIDLLRTGDRVPMRQPLPAADYFVVVSRAERRPITEVWPIQLDQPLPTVPIPLLGRDPDALLDLQQAMTSVYDGFGYDYLIDYGTAPAAPLTPQQSQWAQDRIRSRGFRG